MENMQIYFINVDFDFIFFLFYVNITNDNRSLFLDLYYFPLIFLFLTDNEINN